MFCAPEGSTIGIKERFGPTEASVLYRELGRPSSILAPPMAFDTWRSLLMDREPVPNKWTERMGELIRQARTDAGLSQQELAEKIGRRQTTLSDMERGRIEVDTSTLAMLGDVLRKPLYYFFPPSMYQPLTKDDLDPLEEEALLHFREIRGSNLQKLAIHILRTIRNYDPKDLVIELADYVNERVRREKALEDRLSKHRKKK